MGSSHLEPVAVSRKLAVVRKAMEQWNTDRVNGGAVTPESSRNGEEVNISIIIPAIIITYFIL